MIFIISVVSAKALRNITLSVIFGISVRSAIEDPNAKTM